MTRGIWCGLEYLKKWITLVEYERWLYLYV